MRRQVFRAIFLSLLLTLPILAPAGAARILLVARDLDNHPLSGFRFTYGGVESQRPLRPAPLISTCRPTTSLASRSSFSCSPDLRRTRNGFSLILKSIFRRALCSAEVVLMRRSAFRQIAAETRDAPRVNASRSSEPPEEERRRALVDAAKRHGLTAEQLESAIRSFAETQDPKDRGIAAFLEGQYRQAEELLRRRYRKQRTRLGRDTRISGGCPVPAGQIPCRG